MFQNQKQIFLAVLISFTLSAVFVPLFLGQKEFGGWNILFSDNEVVFNIILNIRLPRIVFAFCAGAGLAVTGAVFQALLRNDLATPYTLGVSSGSALGAVAAIKSGFDFYFFGFSTISIFSIFGSLLTLLIIYRIVKGQAGFSSFTLILTGVTISLTFSAFILFLHYLADFTETYRMVRWLMGGLDVSGWFYPLFTGIILLVVCGFFFSKAAAFNLLTAGEEFSLSKGLNIVRLQKQSFILASILIGTVVSIAGPIAFVGLIVPHALRLLIGPDHRWLFPSAVLLGGAFLIWCDTIARLIIYPAELPVGIITSLLGGPFFLYLLMRSKKY